MVFLALCFCFFFLSHSGIYKDVDDDDNEATSPLSLIMMITGIRLDGGSGRNRTFKRDEICRYLPSPTGRSEGYRLWSLRG